MKNPLAKIIHPLIWMFVLSFIYVQGFAQVSGDHSSREKAVSHQADTDNRDKEKNIVEHKKQDKTMLYKFYKETTKPEASEANSHKLVDEFKKIYDKNDVEFIGLWINADDPHEQFYMTGFKNDVHYQEFLDEVKNNEEYRDMSDEINRHRESIESVTLEPASDLDIENT